ncbi:MAG: potassium transporter TrkG [Corynebacterium sp.]|nr:potassium transporter TrkG [Corynebacterium sp.]
MKHKNVGSWLGPARLTALGFVLLILGGTALLMMPFSATHPQWTPFLPALFTATSAVSLTGLVVVDTGTYWTGIGQAIILLLIQLGGLGIMSLAALSGMVLTGRISLRTRHTAAAEGRPIFVGGIRRTLRFTVLFTLVAESVVAAAVAARLCISYDYPLPKALWTGVFHAVSAFNNAGFGTKSDNLTTFAPDPWVLLPLAAAIIGGGLGYPVSAELIRRVRARWLATATAPVDAAPIVPVRFSVTTRITLAGTAFLLVAGTVFIACAEWQGVLASMPVGERVLNAFFASVSPRTAGFNTFDYGEAHPITLMGTDILMFIGGGSAGTAGGVKATTACILLAAIVAEFLGHEDVAIAHRRVHQSVVRQALALTCAGIAVVTMGVAALRVFDPQFTGDQVLFEVMSAFATVGLSTGITADLSAPSQLVLCVIMYFGRVGPTTLVAALATRAVTLHYSYPEERPFIG